MVASLESALTQLDAEDVSVLPDAALSEDIVALARVIDRARAQLARRVAVFHARRGCVAEGAANTTQWLRWRCRMMPGSAANLVTVARQLAELPGVDEALRSGEIGYDHAATIGRTAEWVGAEAMRGVEADFVDVAKRLDPARVAMAGRWFRARVDPDRFAAEHEQAHELRGLSLSRSGNWFYLDGRLDLEGGAALERALNSLMGARTDNRTARQRRADALVDLALGKARPQLVVVTDERRTSGDLVGVGPVPRETLERVACDASLTEFWIDEQGKLNVGRAKRTWNPATRRALEARDRQCRFPGCDRDTSWCEAHHLVPWAAGGETRADQGVLLCRFHHRLVHARHLELRLEVGELVVGPP